MQTNPTLKSYKTNCPLTHPHPENNFKKSPQSLILSFQVISVQVFSTTLYFLLRGAHCNWKTDSYSQHPTPFYRKGEEFSCPQEGAPRNTAWEPANTGSAVDQKAQSRTRSITSSALFGQVAQSPCTADLPAQWRVYMAGVTLWWGDQTG